MSALTEIARRLRTTIESLASELPDSGAIENTELFPAWSGNGVGYLVGDRVRYNGYLYKVLQSHTSQEGWTPESAPSLFARVLIPDPEGEIPEWVTPTSTSFYNTGDKVHYKTFDDPVYECLIDNCVWSPVEYAVAWRLVTE